VARAPVSVNVRWRMNTLALIGFALYYAAVAFVLNWWLRRRSLWFTSFLAVVLSQALLFGMDYLYRGHWESWNGIALLTSTAMCVVTVAVVAVGFYVRRAKLANAPT